MAYANTDDVEVSLGRSLSAGELSQVESLLDRAETRIVRRIADLATKIADDPTFINVVVEVEADAVARVVRNPDGLLSEQDGDYMYTRDRRVASGALDLTDEEWSRLGVTKGAFTIAPSLGREIGVEPADYPPAYPWTLEPGWSNWP